MAEIDASNGKAAINSKNSIIRERISSAAFMVKVTAKIRRKYPFESVPLRANLMYSMVNVYVLPEPAEAEKSLMDMNFQE